ncbi:DNA-binding transcriptional regulator, LysR family [Actinokineospora alba]|uniref:DNA-binding transcriptional regulator, LysR family n=1 Tax=Actinokineospora alba TaxID=504798 RepID=A0A1H0LWB0_9PSEU|nr:LysR family transcriptional regulator [Actinokineospora alba]TDP67482.1 DNA-binding transcriptional LysR family regulator [Actinokineospora alba]SDI47216.1 DNA-binding transcriptional regulator, LysR family [Actinokineospora alba]SDO72415.1 DNA-binding transcriptional regulator, LysR family [Actinokineospora alba]
MRLELRHLRVVGAIARAGSIRRAAAALLISQPALLGQLQRIEETVGGPVFVRSRTGVEPTELGRFLIAEGGCVVDEFDRLIADTRKRAKEQRALGISAMRDLDSATLIATVTELLPAREIATWQLDSLRAGFDLLAAGDLDVALLYRFPHGTRAPDAVRLLDVVTVEPAFVGLAADHPLAGLTEIPLAALADATWVISAAEDDTGRLAGFHRACAGAGFTPRIRHYVGDCDMAIPLLRGAGSVAVMHPMCVPPDGVVIRPIVGSPHYRSITIAWREESTVDDLVPELRSRLVENYHREVSLRPHYRHWWETNVGPLSAHAPEGATATICAMPAARMVAVRSAT